MDSAGRSTSRTASERSAPLEGRAADVSGATAVRRSIRSEQRAAHLAHHDMNEVSRLDDIQALLEVELLRRVERRLPAPEPCREEEEALYSNFTASSGKTLETSTRRVTSTDKLAPPSCLFFFFSFPRGCLNPPPAFLQGGGIKVKVVFALPLMLKGSSETQASRSAACSPASFTAQPRAALTR